MLDCTPLPKTTLTPCTCEESFMRPTFHLRSAAGRRQHGSPQHTETIEGTHLLAQGNRKARHSLNILGCLDGFTEGNRMQE